MSKLTDLINEISSEMGQSRMTNEEFARISQMLLEVRIEVRTLELRLSQFMNISVTSTPTYSAIPYNNNTDVVV
jgi:hypothetical protein